MRVRVSEEAHAVSDPQTVMPISVWHQPVSLCLYSSNPAAGEPNWCTEYDCISTRSACESCTDFDLILLYF
jgi:hypothetical protein